MNYSVLLGWKDRKDILDTLFGFGEKMDERKQERSKERMKERMENRRV